MPIVINGSTGISGTDGSASTPAIQGSDTNTGMYFPGADRIGFAEGGVQVGEFDASSNFLFNSGYGSVAIAYGCRAWVRFNGQANPASIIGSAGVSSITELSNGVYRVNWSFTFPDANYAVTFAMGDISGVGNEHALVTNYTTTNVQIQTSLSNDSWADAADVCVVAFR